MSPSIRFPEFTGEWERCVLGDVLEFSNTRINSSELNSGNYVSTENILQNFQGIVKARSIPEDTNVMAFSCGNILLSNIRPYLKKVWKATFNGGCSSDVFVLQANSNIDADYLHYVVANDKFIGFVMNGAKGVKMPRGDKNQMKTYSLSLPSIKEQRKISRFLSFLDERIAVQNRLIEDLKKLRCAIVEKMFKQSKANGRLGDFIEQVSVRNKNGLYSNVLSVSNKQGFVKQSEQFEDRTVASEDTSNYKIVKRNNFAYNPARINVGSIARLTKFDVGIVSPMYVCFRTKASIIPEYMEAFFTSQQFFYEMMKRLEGSVRLCLSYEGLCNIPVYIPDMNKQIAMGQNISLILSKIGLEIEYLGRLHQQKQYLLRKMFI